MQENEDYDPGDDNGQDGVFAAELPGVVFYTPPVSAVWLLGMGLVVWGTLSGRFASRPLALLVAWGLCGLWLMGPVAHQQTIGRHRDAWQLHAWAVGNGSAYLIQSGGRTILYDCGSSSHAAVTETVLGPALRSAGVHGIDTLILSHPDLDHFSGTVELTERFTVKEVLVNEAFVEEASAEPRGAASVVLNHLNQKKIPVQIVHAGWRHRAGRAELAVHWPNRGARFRSHNDGSLVLSVTGGGRRLLLCGDVQDAAMKRMTAQNLPGRADVLEIPHHGSLAAEAAPQWARAIRPRIAIQSTAEGSRTHKKPWKKYSHLCITACRGAVRLRVGLDGTMRLWRYRKRGWTPEHPPTYNVAAPSKEPLDDANHPSGPAGLRADRADGRRSDPKPRRADQIASP